MELEIEALETFDDMLPDDILPNDSLPNEALEEMLFDEALDEMLPDEALDETLPDEALDETLPDEALDEMLPIYWPSTGLISSACDTGSTLTCNLLRRVELVAFEIDALDDIFPDDAFPDVALDDADSLGSNAPPSIPSESEA